MIPHSQLYGRTQIQSSPLEGHVVSVHEIEQLLGENTVYSDFVNSLNMRRSSSETYAIYEEKFNNVLKKFEYIDILVSHPKKFLA